MKDFLKSISKQVRFLRSTKTCFLKGKIPQKKIFTGLFFIFLAIFIVLLGLEIYYVNKIDKLMIQNPPMEEIYLSQYPVLTSNYEPQISAEKAIIIDADSKVVLYEKNAYEKNSTASTAKIMTALTALEGFDLNEVLVVKTATDEGALIGLDVGERISFESLLYAMLLPSGNDAAQTIAQNYKGGQEKFISDMNNNAKKWHLENTHFDDPAGLIDEGDYTTPRELAELATIALKNPVFARTVATRYKAFSSVDGMYSYSVGNLNRLLGFYGVNGVKTGFTEGAGQVLVTSKLEPVNPKEGEKQHKLIIVVMNSKDRFADTEELLKLVSGNVNYLSIRP